MGRVLWIPQQIAPKKGRKEQGISSSTNIPPTCVKHQPSFEHLKRISDDLTIKISGLETFKLSVCALCIHSLDVLGCSPSEFLTTRNNLPLFPSSFIQNLHKGFYSSIAWPDERVSSRALGGMPRSLKFWLLDNCSISFKMLLLMKQYFEYKILCFESVFFAISRSRNPSVLTPSFFF